LEVRISIGVKEFNNKKVEKMRKNFIKLEFSDKDSERMIGLADLMPSKVRKVLVMTPGGVIREAERSGTKGGFFYEGGQYAKVLNSYKVKISEINNEAGKELSAQYDAKFSKEYLAGLELENEEEKKTIINVSKEYGIDSKILIALRKTENGEIGKEMGILGYNTKSFLDQARLSARTIQNNMKRFEKNFPGEKAVDKDLKFTPEFIVFFSNIYAPVGVGNDKNNLNKNHKNNLSSLYGVDISNVTSSKYEKINSIRYNNIDLKDQINSGERLSYSDAMNRLRENGISIKSSITDTRNRNNPESTTPEGLRPKTIKGLAYLKNKLGMKNGEMLLTGLTEDGHSGGLYSEGITHGNGYKADVSFRNEFKNKLVKYLNKKGTSSHQAKEGTLYELIDGEYNFKFLIEDDHVDIAIN
jgi:hypothetical protein